MTEARRGPLNHTLAEVDGRPTIGCITPINPTPTRPKTSILSPSQREVVEALESVRAPATALRLVEVLAARGIAHDRHTVGHCLSALAVHGLTRVVDYLPSRSGRGTRQILWARTETPIPAATRRSVIVERLEAILRERGPMAVKPLAALAHIKPVRLVRIAKTMPNLWLMRDGWTEARPIAQDIPKGGRLLLCLDTQADQAPAAFEAHAEQVRALVVEGVRRHRANRPPNPKAEKPERTKPTPKPKPIKPPKPRPEPKPKPVLEPKPKVEKPKVQAPKPAPSPDPFKPTAAQAAPQPRALLTPDMTTGERIERIRAHFARALPRLRRDGSVTHLHLRDGQLRHRARD